MDFTWARFCGRPNSHLNPRIIGGADASEGAWPWMVSLHNTTDQEHFCGGSHINSEWVLTAAHCVFGEDMNTLLVYLGKRTQQGHNANQINRTVNNIIPHPSYNAGTCDNDIALLHLSSAVTFNDYIRPVCLAAQNSNLPPRTKGWITGWGDIGNQMPLPPPGILQEAEVEVYENSDCSKICCGPITPHMICAGTPQGGRGHGEGDSGGPMVHKQCLVWVQSGVISWGERCAQPDYPDGYTRVSEFQQWITGHIVQNLPGFVVFNPQAACSSASQAEK
ncbi:tryptase beta-2-like [Carassius carassius]|uniref:tryptase beta-2-like n=1 Tax=Carassius carassius TaxID=217509 RepID=UPI0028684393|nr:tryptase beta-2-like [Carassius carassius]